MAPPARWCTMEVEVDERRRLVSSLPLKLQKIIALGGGRVRADLDHSVETCALSSVQDLFVNNSGMIAS